MGTAFCVDGGREAIVLALTWWGNSKSEANSLAQAAAQVKAGKLGCITDLAKSCCKNATFSSQVVLGSSFGMVAPFHWSVVGFLPPGVTMAQNGFSATIAGTPTASGDFPFRLEFIDFFGNTSYRNFTLHVMEITQASPLPAAMENDPYSETISHTGGVAPFAWGLQAGDSLPPGFVLDGETGEISASPAAAPGTYTFHLVLSDEAT